MIHIGRGTARLGTFSEDEVRQGLASGRFLLSDLGWREGMADWLPLGEFSEFSDAPPPLPSFAPGMPATGLQPERPGLPWEHRQELGNFNSFVETVKLVLTAPSDAFSRMRLEGGLGGPLIFNIAGGWLALVMAIAYQVLWLRVSPVPETLSANPWAITETRSIAALITATLFGPFLILIGAFVGSFMTHLFLMLVGGANKPFEATMRVVCFTAGSCQLLQLVPFCGGLLSAVWQFVCLTIGLSKAHEISIGRALLAVFLPVIVCCGGLLLFAGIAFGVHMPILHQ